MTDKRASELLSENLTAIYGYAFSKLYDKDKVDDLASEIVYEIIVSARNLQNEDPIKLRRYLPSTLLLLSKDSAEILRRSITVLT